MAPLCDLRPALLGVGTVCGGEAWDDQYIETVGRQVAEQRLIQQRVMSLRGDMTGNNQPLYTCLVTGVSGTTCRSEGASVTDVSLQQT